MNDREKRLVLVLGLIAVGIGVLFGYKTYADYRTTIQIQTKAAELTLENAENFLALREQAADELAWLAENEPEPNAIQNVRPAIQQFATKRAEEVGLTVLSPSFPPDAETTGHYGRARVQMTVTGTEEALYRWLHEIQSPKDFRTVVSINLTPKRDDDTKISCIVVIEQWFVPEPSPS